MLAYIPAPWILRVIPLIFSKSWMNDPSWPFQTPDIQIFQLGQTESPGFRSCVSFHNICWRVIYSLTFRKLWQSVSWATSATNSKVLNKSAKELCWNFVWEVARSKGGLKTGVAVEPTKCVQQKGVYITNHTSANYQWYEIGIVHAFFDYPKVGWDMNLPTAQYLVLIPLDDKVRQVWPHNKQNVRQLAKSTNNAGLVGTRKNVLTTIIQNGALYLAKLFFTQLWAMAKISNSRDLPAYEKPPEGKPTGHPFIWRSKLIYRRFV